MEYVKIPKQLLVGSKNKEEFVKKHLNFLDEFEIEDIWRKLVRTKFKKDTDYYLGDDRGIFKVKSLNFEIKYPKDYEEILKKFKEFTEGSNLNKEELWEKNHFNSLFKNYWLQLKKPGVFTVSEFGLKSLFDLLLYVITGKKEKDIGEAVDIMEQNDITYNSIFKDKKIEGLPGNITMTVYKNGKVVIKGLKKNQWSDIERISSIFK